MIRCIYSLLFEARIDRMTMAEIEAAGAEGSLTLAELRRVAQVQRYADGLSR